MSEDFQRNKDIEEIFLHIKQIKSEQDNLENKREDRLNPEDKINLDNIPPEDVFEIVELENELSDETSELSEETISKIKVDIDSLGLCDLCKQEIDFEKNLSGLVIHGKFFACEKCCQVASKDELMNWTKSKMSNLEDVKPIVLWFMQEKNKSRLFEK
jgi:RNA polymerase-binding transcription factor DksA